MCLFECGHAQHAVDGEKDDIATGNQNQLQRQGIGFGVSQVAAASGEKVAKKKKSGRMEGFD